MATRLLNKSEVDKAKALERHQEIQEGKKLAERVDSLRQLSAQEEQSLEKTRESLLTNLWKEVDEVTKKRDALVLEMDSLRKELASETNLTREERTHLQELKVSLEKKQIELADRSQILDLLEIDIAEALQSARDELVRSEGYRMESEQLRSVSLQKEYEAKEVLQRAQTIEEKTIKVKKDAENEFDAMRHSLSLKEKELSKQEQENKKTALALDQEKVRLADQRQTLDRAIERLRKNRL